MLQYYNNEKTRQAADRFKQKQLQLKREEEEQHMATLGVSFDAESHHFSEEDELARG